MANELSNPVFRDAGKAREWLEAELWPDGPVCPHCGGVGCAGRVKGKTARPGLYMCNACRKQFTVTVGTIFERSHIPLNVWLQVVFLMCASKKGVSAHQIHRMIGVTYKTAWFMCHRIREAMREGKFSGPLGGGNTVVEADETYVGGKAHNRKYHVPPKEPVVALIERDGRVRSQHVTGVSGRNLRPIIEQWSDSREVIHPVSWPLGLIGRMERWQGSDTSPKRSWRSCGRLTS